MKAGPAPWLLGCLLMAAVAVAGKLIPRLSFQRGDPSREISLFSQKDVLNYDTFLLSADGETLYVGGRDAILALDLRSPRSLWLKGEISWRPTPVKQKECVFKKKSNETECFNFIRVLVQLNESHLYACGTNAFSPTCAYVDLENFTLVSDAKGQPLLQEGKGLCPFDPQHRNTALVVDGELYTGTNNFQGNDPVISRTLGSRTGLKTDSFLSWLRDDAVFVASFNIPNHPDDEKIYFFFEETAEEFDFFEKLTVSRVARVCKNDIGGDKVLQKKWTTFLKAQLSCAQPGHFPFTVIQHAFALPQLDGGTVFYGVFASQWPAGDPGSSAVCAFSLEAVENAFERKYKELNKDCSRWVTYSGPASDPRPGSCSVSPSSDKALTFMKDHFLMDEKIHNLPLLVKDDVNYTRIAVHQTQGDCGGPCNVLFLGTARGFLHKAVVVGQEAHIVEEIQLFEKPEPVRNLLLVPEKAILYVGYSGGILQVPLANCSAYTTCTNCLLARDPYCAWDGRSCRAIWENTADRTSWLQDIKAGRPEPGCHRSSGMGRAAPRSWNSSDGGVQLKVVTRPPNSVARMLCPHVSALASYAWDFRESKRLPAELVVADGGDLLVIVQSHTLGAYKCWASENGYRHLVAWYDIRADLTAEGASGAKAGLEPQAVPVGEWRSYWVQFVTVTVLLSLTLVGTMALGCFSYHDKLKARSKVQGCCAPGADRTSQQEKVPLNGSRRPPGGREYQMHGAFQEAVDGAKSCCVHVEGGTRDVDADNNCLDRRLDEAAAAVAPAGM